MIFTSKNKDSRAVKRPFSTDTYEFWNARYVIGTPRQFSKLDCLVMARWRARRCPKRGTALSLAGEGGLSSKFAKTA
jgi:hypothetical protein